MHGYDILYLMDCIIRILYCIVENFFESIDTCQHGMCLLK